MPLSAAEVLAGGLAVKNAAGMGSVWCKPAAPLKPTAKAVVATARPAPAPSSATLLVDNDATACAASALLGLQKEPARMSHKQVEQHRRLKAKQYFDELRCLVPTGCDPKNDRNKVLQLAIEHLRNLQAGKLPSSACAAQDSEPDLMFSMDAEDGQQPKTDCEADKRLSHNEVEQKRRQQARQHYDQLRALLPNAGKYDKNTVLFHAIQLIRQLQGVSEQDLAKMVRELLSSEVSEQEPGQHQAASNLALLANAKTTISESPTDVVSFAATMALYQQDETHKNSRKRTSDMLVAASAQQPALKQEAQGHVQGESTEAEGDSEMERKKARRLSGEGVVADVTANSDGQDCTKDDSAQKQAESDFEAEMDSLDALSLLSHCAAQLQASQPPTPLMAPISREGSWGEVSMMNALPPSSCTGKGPRAAKAAAKT